MDSDFDAGWTTSSLSSCICREGRGRVGGGCGGASATGLPIFFFRFASTHVHSTIKGIGSKVLTNRHYYRLCLWVEWREEKEEDEEKETADL